MPNLATLLDAVRTHAAELFGTDAPIDVIIRLRGTCRAVRYSLDCAAADRTVSLPGVRSPVQTEPDAPTVAVGTPAPTLPIVEPIRLTLSEKKLVRACLDARLTGKAACSAARLDYTGYWRSILAGLVRKGALTKDADGYLATGSGRVSV